MAQSGSNKKIANSLVAAGAAAVLAVYTAGYARTRSAADQFDAESAQRRPGMPEGRGPAPVHGEPATASPAISANRQATAPSTVATLDRAPAPQGLGSVSQGAAVPPPSAPASSATTAPTAPAPNSTTPAPSAAVPEAPVAVAAPPPVAVAAVSAPAPAAAPPAAAATTKWKDGAYTGWGTCRHGDIQAEVIIEGGRIKSAGIAQCLTRYSCDVIGRLLPEVAQRQSAEVDYVSGATQSTNAFYFAVIDALSKAK